MNELEQAFSLIEKHGGGDFSGKKDISLVDEAEEILGLSFPPTYRKFLEILGSGDIVGCEFYGITNKGLGAFGIPNVVWLTLEKRKTGMPKSLIPIYSEGDGSYYCLDTSQTSDCAECPIVLYGINGEIGSQVANNFGIFMLTVLEEMTE